MQSPTDSRCCDPRHLDPPRHGRCDERLPVLREKFDLTHRSRREFVVSSSFQVEFANDGALNLHRRKWNANRSVPGWVQVCLPYAGGSSSTLRRSSSEVFQNCTPVMPVRTGPTLESLPRS